MRELLEEVFGVLVSFGRLLNAWGCESARIAAQTHVLYCPDEDDDGR
ncbi:hypothetical protein [Trinickia mobilis]|nr:hypothetical protein [Trinickia mobilis]